MYECVIYHCRCPPRVHRLYPPPYRSSYIPPQNPQRVKSALCHQIVPRRTKNQFASEMKRYHRAWLVRLHNAMPQTQYAPPHMQSLTRCISSVVSWLRGTARCDAAVASVVGCGEMYEMTSFHFSCRRVGAQFEFLGYLSVYQPAITYSHIHAE